MVQCRRILNFEDCDTSPQEYSIRSPPTKKRINSNSRRRCSKLLVFSKGSSQNQRDYGAEQDVCAEESERNYSQFPGYQSDRKGPKLYCRKSKQEQLISDFTRPCTLPVVTGENLDLKSITCETLSKLIMGEYSDSIESFMIIDCRYPYEFEGGHIRGAVNFNSRDHIMNQLLKNRAPEEHLSPGRNILVFHSEFSLKRSPALLRYLRKQDHWLHDYPTLAYPEVYLLHGGYEAFFQCHKGLCEPQNYISMLDPKHITDSLLY